MRGRGVMKVGGNAGNCINERLGGCYPECRFWVRHPDDGGKGGECAGGAMHLARRSPAEGGDSDIGGDGDGVEVMAVLSGNSCPLRRESVVSNTMTRGYWSRDTSHTRLTEKLWGHSRSRRSVGNIDDAEGHGYCKK
ncbi:hypothetical protein Tco_0802488 [Tanacetum coccineum]|uniref:Uncharacterized protein n=1 Tax=Tanacetum coccineum TaxID=301880 RepID=A0ABQ4WII9_9ASTR